MLGLIGRELEYVVGDFLEVGGTLAKVDRVRPLHRLLDAGIDQILSDDSRETRHVIDVLFRIQRVQLAAKLGQGVDHFCASSTHARIEEREQAGGTAADHRDIKNIHVYLSSYAHVKLPALLPTGYASTERKV